MKCPICRQDNSRGFCKADDKEYFRCDTCHATFLNPASYLSSAQERAHYLHHENEVDDPAYRSFSQKLAEPLLSKLTRPSKGLDYGCGPGPALASILQEQGHKVDLYDPYFYPTKPKSSTKFDFITCSETAEHFFHPAQEFELFDKLLAPGGWLAIMTCFQSDDSKFKNWHYRRDPTHVVFYHQNTFRWIANRLQFSCEFPHKDVVLMQKPD